MRRKILLKTGVALFKFLNVMIKHLAPKITPVSCRCTEADLRIGELQWGDSGVYFCKVVIADDLEGKNEAQLELLVLGRPPL